MVDNSADVTQPLPRRRLGFVPFEARRRLGRHRQSQTSLAGAPTIAGSAWKRRFDVVFAAAVLLALAPLLLLIAAGLLIADGRPIFYSQRRIGRNGQMFSCLKFRSMVKDADAQLQALLASSPSCRAEWDETQKLRSDPRIHWMGRILRKTSLDELPQFINVLRGDMSVVGPRPIVQSEVARYGQDFAHYKSVRPGVTGLWQVSGRNELSYNERVALDVRYASNVSFSEDLRIISKTVGIVALGTGDH